MKLLVTGGSGFIGSNFIRHVLAAHPDDRVVNLDKLTYAGNPANLADLAGDSRYAFVQGDVCDAKVVRGEVQGVVMVGGSTRMPAVRTAGGEFFGREPLTDLNPDEVVALGAAIQANALAGHSTHGDLLLLEPNSDFFRYLKDSQGRAAGRK